MNGFAALKNDTIEQSDRPDSITRKEAEKIVRGILKGHLGNMPENLFKDSVNELLEEINGHS